jgi:hypothetical protein
MYIQPSFTPNVHTTQFYTKCTYNSVLYQKYIQPSFTPNVHTTQFYTKCTYNSVYTKCTYNSVLHQIYIQLSLHQIYLPLNSDLAVFLTNAAPFKQLFHNEI